MVRSCGPRRSWRCSRCGQSKGAVDGAGGGFDVASLPGLSLWLDAARGVSDPMVTTWSDQSPNADTLSAGAMAPDRLEDEINGAPTVQLQATATMTLSGPHAGAAVAFGTGELLVEVVARWYPSVTLLQTDRGLAVSGGATAEVSVAGHAVQTTATVGDGTFHLVGARRDGSGAGTTLEMRVNGGVDGTATGLDYAQDLGAASPAPVALLGPGNNVEIAELVVVNGATTAADLARLESYLLTKYALP